MKIFTMALVLVTLLTSTPGALASEEMAVASLEAPASCLTASPVDTIQELAPILLSENSLCPDGLFLCYCDRGGSICAFQWECQSLCCELGSC